ncbi:MAG: hypothetical protein FWD57_06420 [Polyangiaceae bacterium]|nr:hypothetical protein [Polyangiaceae bacterium]
MSSSTTPALTRPTPSDLAQARKERVPRLLLEYGALGMLLAVVLSCFGQETLGGPIAVAAALALVIGLHLFGRLGPDAPMQFGRVGGKSRKNHSGKTSKKSKRAAPCVEQSCQQSCEQSSQQTEI